MTTLTIRVPDDVAERLKSASQSRGISVNKFVTEISVQALATHDAETRFKTLASQADIPAALALLDRLENK
jgi:predicted transcriptional regulator